MNQNHFVTEDAPSLRTRIVTLEQTEGGVKVLVNEKPVCGFRDGEDFLIRYRAGLETGLYNDNDGLVGIEGRRL
jgi:hypothetical protein